MSEFRKYNTIINDHDKKKISDWIAYNPYLRTTDYIATEKIDGANFGVHFYSNGEVYYTSRTKMIGSDDLFGYKYILDNNSDYQKLEKSLRAFSQERKINFILYGELYGSSVLKRVKYNKGILFYDVFVIDAKVYWPFSAIERIFEEFNLKNLLVPIVYSVTGIEEALNLNPIFRSLLTPEEFEGDNFAEGIVVKPYNSDVYVEEYGRFSIKIKHPKFKDISSSSSSEKKNIVLPDDLKVLAEMAFDYVNENRLIEVVSKLGPLYHKEDIGLYVKEFNIDYKTAFMDDNEDEYKALEKVYGKTDTKRIFKASNNEASRLVNELFVKTNLSVEV